MFRRRRAGLVVFGALAVLLAALSPAGPAAGSHDATDGPSFIFLELGKNDQVTWLGHSQKISLSRRTDCTSVSFPPDILNVTAGGGQLGFVKDGLGVKSATDGSGDPCGRVEKSAGESLSVALGAEADGFLMSAIDLDVELKFNAEIDVILNLDGVEVARLPRPFTGSGGSDDGPDSGDGDNHRLFFDPDGDVLFDEVVLIPLEGSLTLEGGADGTDNGQLASNNFSQFRVVKTFDGQITCGIPESIADGDIEEVVGEVTMQALKLGSTWEAACSEEKNYNDNVTASSLLFAPALDVRLARYTLELTIRDQPITTEADGQISSLVMEYNDGSTGAENMPLRPCLDQPDFQDPEFFEQAPTTGVLPEGEFACYYTVTLMPTGDDVGTEVWSIYFEDDPQFVF